MDSAAYTPFPPDKAAASYPICLGSDGTAWSLGSIWISKRGIGFTGGDCGKPPRLWANLWHPIRLVGWPGIP